MASSIAAITTGTGGIQQTADASGNLNLVSGTTTIVAMTSAGIAVTGTLTASGTTTLVTPVLGTPTSGALTNCTLIPAAQLTGTVAVASGGTGVATSTGSGANVLGTSPTMATPTFNSAQLATVSGTAPLYMARAWVNFNGTGTVAINASGNVSSITDNGTGDYTVNFTTAMTDTNGTVVGAAVETVGAFSGGLRVVTPSFASTSTIRLGVTYTNGGVVDTPYVGIAIFR